MRRQTFGWSCGAPSLNVVQVFPLGDNLKKASGAKSIVSQAEFRNNFELFTEGLLTAWRPALSRAYLCVVHVGVGQGCSLSISLYPGNSSGSRQAPGGSGSGLESPNTSGRPVNPHCLKYWRGQDSVARDSCRFITMRPSSHQANTSCHRGTTSPGPILSKKELCFVVAHRTTAQVRAASGIPQICSRESCRGAFGFRAGRWGRAKPPPPPPKPSPASPVSGDGPPFQQVLSTRNGPPTGMVGDAPLFFGDQFSLSPTKRPLCTLKQYTP